MVSRIYRMSGKTGKPRKRFRPLKRIKNHLIFLLALSFIAVARRIPLRSGLKIGAFLGRVIFFLDRPDRRKILTHLRVAFPEKTEAWRMEIGRRTCMNLGRMAIELFHFDELLPTGAAGDERNYVRIVGLEHLEAQRRAGRGGLIVSAHCGNWELMPPSAARFGFRVANVVRNLYDPRLDALLNAHRIRYDYRPIVRSGFESAREIFRALRRNELVGILIDQDTKVRSVFVPFFGRPARTPVGAALIAYQAKLDALTSFIHRRPEGGHTMVISPPLKRPETGDREADLRGYTAMLTKAIEDNIRAHPDEWVWMHRRWKRRPEDEAAEDNPVAKARLAAR